MAPNTWRAYRSDLADFATWVDYTSADWKAPEVVATYLRTLEDGGAPMPPSAAVSPRSTSWSPSPPSPPATSTTRIPPNIPGSESLSSRSCSATSPPTGAQHRLPCPPGSLLTGFFPIPGVPGRPHPPTSHRLVQSPRQSRLRILRAVVLGTLESSGRIPASTEVREFGHDLLMLTDEVVRISTADTGFISRPAIAEDQISSSSAQITISEQYSPRFPISGSKVDTTT